MKIKASRIRMKRKPTQEEYKRIVYGLKEKNSNIDVTCVQLAKLLENGHSVILAEYSEEADEVKSISTKYIISTQLLVLDVETDKTINKDSWNLKHATEVIYEKYGIKPIIVYETFSSTSEDPRGRLIYFIEIPINAEDYRKIIEVMLGDESINGRFDKQTKNLSRIWQGTDKEVQIRKDYKPINEDLIQRLLNTYENIKPQIQANRSQITYTGRKGAITDLADRVKVKSEYRMVVKDLINTSVNVVEFLQSHFGLQLNRHCNLNQNIINCRCPIHNGHNEKGFAIFQNTNSCCCFGDCDRSFDIMQLGYYYYGEFNFNKIALTIIDEYNLSIDERWVEIL